MEHVKAPIKKYWDQRSSSYGLDSEKSAAAAETWGTVLQELAPYKAGHCALDVGTGTGQFAVYLAKNGFEVTGVDLSAGMIEKAQHNAAQEGLPIHFQVGDAEHLDFADNSFDVLVSRNLLWTLPQPEQALREWKRVLKPGGRLVLSDGLWMNTTWKRMHHLAINLLKDIFRSTSRRSLRFFWNYAVVQHSLPFYAGVEVTDAILLLEQACFSNISCYDTACFADHPYQSKKFKKKNLSFFIVYADK